ncbi:hypothetical protein MCOR27_009917 [Pyricularia oryzae]|uniref:Uncharacterized protein n=1 Tax=Pyricularia grisea TaxID=148305 RepID=A0ABQ8N7D6_PYRGI|nr:hypothetical protein MCOR01_000460 [Pyricularia oryzae]KAI6292492.1 hypothetical protein MCOR33_009826 [Pyricularia grisea]KAI6252093.1 hypothetical protein MCOR19_011279 [Pyricularia oryzae]KAI6267504.1 hypothetical protein MCOR26_009677 [Pyricularia oryzae]KAI6269021.1 hypothetical protein MCOR27_009917 [Pyricularia oryzae]
MNNKEETDSGDEDYEDECTDDDYDNEDEGSDDDYEKLHEELEELVKFDMAWGSNQDENPEEIWEARVWGY